MLKKYLSPLTRCFIYNLFYCVPLPFLNPLTVWCNVISPILSIFSLIFSTVFNSISPLYMCTILFCRPDLWYLVFLPHLFVNFLPHLQLDNRFIYCFFLLSIAFLWFIYLPHHVVCFCCFVLYTLIILSLNIFHLVSLLYFCTFSSNFASLVLTCSQYSSAISSYFNWQVFLPAYQFVLSCFFISTSTSSSFF